MREGTYQGRVLTYDVNSGLVVCVIPSLFGDQPQICKPAVARPGDIAAIAPVALNDVVWVFSAGSDDSPLQWMPCIRDPAFDAYTAAAVAAEAALRTAADATKLSTTNPTLASGRSGYVPLGRVYLSGVSGGAAPAYISFLVNGVSLSCKTGDQISMRYGVIPALSSGDFRSFFQVFTPGGGSVGSTNTLSSDEVTGNINVTIEDLYTCTADGTHTVTVVGGMTSGSATLFNQYLVTDLLGAV